MTKNWSLRNTLVLLLCILCVRVYAEDAHIQSRLQSPDWRLRRVAYSQIRKDKSPAARMQLIGLLATENAVARQAYRTGIGVEGKYGEQYVVYKENLTQFVLSNFKQFHDRQALDVLLHTAYNPDSIFALWLARQGTVLLPITDKMLDSDIYPDRESAVAMVAHIITASRKGDVILSAQQQAQAHGQLIRALHSEDMWTREAAVRYIGQVGGLSDIPVLTRISADDPGFDSKTSVYPVRNAAHKAAAEIRARTKSDRISE